MGVLAGRVGLNFEADGTREVVGGFMGDVGLEGARALYDMEELKGGLGFSGLGVPANRLRGRGMPMEGGLDEDLMNREPCCADPEGCGFFILFGVPGIVLAAFSGRESDSLAAGFSTSWFSRNLRFRMLLSMSPKFASAPAAASLSF